MDTPEESLRVLFIGNSHTYVNDLPALVAQMAQATGSTLEYQTIARPNFGLMDHWAVGEAQEAIRRGGWDYVVLQQGPSSQPDSRVNLVEWGTRFANLIHENGARAAFYMVWPAESRPTDHCRPRRDRPRSASQVLAWPRPRTRTPARRHPDTQRQASNERTGSS